MTSQISILRLSEVKVIYCVSLRHEAIDLFLGAKVESPKRCIENRWA